jgi:hypothetical protein
MASKMVTVQYIVGLSSSGLLNDIVYTCTPRIRGPHVDWRGKVNIRNLDYSNCVGAIAISSEFLIDPYLRMKVVVTGGLYKMFVRPAQ